MGQEGILAHLSLICLGLGDPVPAALTISFFQYYQFIRERKTARDALILVSLMTAVGCLLVYIVCRAVFLGQSQYGVSSHSY
jgi:cytochrome c biogenesis protein CcdA